MRLFENLINLIAPLHCLYCDAEGAVMCEACLSSELVNLPSCCFSCSKLSANFATCPACSRHSSLRAVWSVCDYSSSASSIIRSYKYDSTREVSKTVVQEMLKVLPVVNFLVTNIPTDSRRVRQRGFDHCALIAKEIAKRRNLLYDPLLYRTKSIHQVGATKSERIRQTKDLFQVKNKNFLRDKTVLLIDDVATTGATMQSAARVLRDNGAKEIYGLVFAKNI